MRNIRVGLGCQFTLNLLSCHHIFWPFSTSWGNWPIWRQHLSKRSFPYLYASYMIGSQAPRWSGLEFLCDISFLFSKIENNFLFPAMVFGFFPGALRGAGGIEWIAVKIGFPLFAVGGSGENSQSNKSPHRPLVNFPNLAASDQIGFWGFHISSLPHLQSHADEMVWWKTFRNKVHLERGAMHNAQAVLTRLRLVKNAGINWLEDQIWTSAWCYRWKSLFDQNRKVSSDKYAWGVIGSD